nr:MAG TPA: oxygen sensor protein [Caudoviricetes sp.]
MVRSLCAVMHYYPHMSKLEAIQLSQSQISSLLEMV